MIRKSMTNDRKKIVRALEEATGLQANYLGAPSFAYEIGPYTVDRDGTVSSDTPDLEVLEMLVAKELILPEDTDDMSETIINLPLLGHDGRSLRNLINMLRSKHQLLGKAVGRPGFYWVSEQLIRNLAAADLKTVEDVQAILADHYDGDLKGLSFDDGKISIHFPYTIDPDRLHAYAQLSECMVKTAKGQKRVQAKECKDANEKYTFRVWLIRIGMSGEEYKTARKILLKNLKGHTSFRTKDQADAAKEKLIQKRKEEKERAAELAFHRL